MGCGPSTPKKLPEVKLLLQGTAGCGKSTFAKQMKIIHGESFTDEERAYYKQTLSVNVILGLKNLLEFVDTEDVDEEMSGYLTFLEDADPYNFVWTKEAATTAKLIYSNETFKAIRQKNKTEFTESLDYAIARLDTISSADWTPSDEDILHARGRTSGMLETRFDAGNVTWNLVDVGGQAQERRKWQSQQTGVGGLLFFVATDEYDVPSDETKGKSRLEVSLSVWEETIHNEQIAGKCAIILFLNKCDLLEKKLKKQPKSLKKAFKKYNSGFDVSSALKFLGDQYMARVKPETGLKPQQIYIHQTCALDTNQMKVVFQSVRDFVVTSRMEKANII